jgi:hypothetical protein
MEPALDRPREESESGLAEPTDRTRQRLEAALTEATEQDTEFAGLLRAAVEEVHAVLKAADPGHSGYTVSRATFNVPTAVVIGRQDNHFGSA